MEYYTILLYYIFYNTIYYTITMLILYYRITIVKYRETKMI